MSRRVTRISRKLNPGIYGRPDGKLQALLKIPADLHFAYGRAKRVVSLHTDDPTEANRRHADEVSKDQTAFESLRRGTSSAAFENFARNLHAAQTREIARVADEQLAATTFSPNAYTAPGLAARLPAATRTSDDPQGLRGRLSPDTETARYFSPSGAWLVAERCNLCGSAANSSFRKGE